MEFVLHQHVILKKDMFYINCLEMCRMANIKGTIVDIDVHTLPSRVVHCEDVFERSWMTKCITLKNEVGKDVAKGTFHNGNADLIIDNDNQSLENDYVVVQIRESLPKYDGPYDWLFQLQSSYICKVSQMVLASTIMTRKTSSILHQQYCAYESSREQKNSNKIPKKEALFTFMSIMDILQSLAAQRIVFNQSLVERFKLSSLNCIFMEVSMIRSIDNLMCTKKFTKTLTEW